jgi:hypothetical protein
MLRSLESSQDRSNKTWGFEKEKKKKKKGKRDRNGRGRAATEELERCDPKAGFLGASNFSFCSSSRLHLSRFCTKADADKHALADV